MNGPTKKLGTFRGVIDDVTTSLDSDAITVTFAACIPGEPLHCRQCGCERPTYYDVCNGQKELRCNTCHRVVKRLETDRLLVSDPLRCLNLSHHPEWDTAW